MTSGAAPHGYLIGHNHQMVECRRVWGRSANRSNPSLSVKKSSPRRKAKCKEFDKKLGHLYNHGPVGKDHGADFYAHRTLANSIHIGGRTMRSPRLRFPSLAVFFLFCIALGTASPVGAVEWKERPLLSWEKKALRYFDRNDYNRAMEIARDEEEDPNGNAPLIIYYCHAQKYYLERDRNSAIYFKRHYRTTEGRLRGENLAVLTRLVSFPSVEWNKKINKKFLDKAFEHAGTDEFLGPILYYLEKGSPDVSKAALIGLKTLLQKKRNIVMNGGTLSRSDRAWMSDRRLLTMLIRISGQGINPAAGFMSKIPAFVRSKVMGGAPACLALIEEPALPLLREAAGLGNASASATIQLIQDAKGARLAKYPNSTWYSATGK